MKSKEVVFVSRYKGFDKIEELRPYPAHKYAPAWYKKMPGDHGRTLGIPDKLIPNLRTVKLCPSFHEVFSEGFILPAPCDLYLSVNDDAWTWRTANHNFGFEIHDNDQMISYLPGDAGVRQVFKFLYPYEIIAPKGYSIRQIPMIYDFNKDWHVGYGIFEADRLPEIALQIYYTSDKDEILIKAGTPLCYYVPFKREKFKLKIGSFKKFETWINASQHRAFTSFKLSYRRWF